MSTMKSSLAWGILAVLITQLRFVYPQLVCPSECSCYPAADGAGVIDCSNRGLTTIPDLYYPGMSQIAKVDLSNNMLTTIDLDQVYKLIAGLRIDVFDFSYNSINDIIGNFDYTASREYTTLNLSNNAFSSVPPNVIPIVHARSNLILDFSYNRLTELPRHMFAGGTDPTLFGFEFLARNNKISRIDDDAFQGVSLVDVVLDLRFNLLTTLSPSFKNPTGVEEFRFSGNPWNCDCNLRWIINPDRYFFNNTENDPPNCQTPAALQGNPIFSLKANEFACLPFQAGPLQRNILNQDSFSLTCPATADPPTPEITWTVWLPSPNGDDPLVFFFTSDEVTLSNINPNPRAAFRCTASNNAGNVDFDLDILIDGEKGIPIPRTSVGPPGKSGDVVTTQSIGGITQVTMKTTSQNDVNASSASQPVAGIIILVIILLLSWGLVVFLIYRIWNLKKELRSTHIKPTNVDNTVNGHDFSSEPTPVIYSPVKRIHQNGSNGTTEPQTPVYAAPETMNPVKPSLPKAPPPPVKPSSNRYQYNTEQQYDDPPLRFGLSNDGYDYNNSDSVI